MSCLTLREVARLCLGACLLHVSQPRRASLQLPGKAVGVGRAKQHAKPGGVIAAARRDTENKLRHSCRRCPYEPGALRKVHSRNASHARQKAGMRQDDERCQAAKLPVTFRVKDTAAKLHLPPALNGSLGLDGLRRAGSRHGLDFVPAAMMAVGCTRPIEN